MKMKKKTRKRITKIGVILMCLIMLLPIVAELIPHPAAEEEQVSRLLQEQMELQKYIGDTIEGSYLVTEAITPDTYQILWGDEERTIKLIGVKADLGYLEDVRELVEAKILHLAFDETTEDAEGNLLVYAYLEDGEFLNQKLIQEGMASHKKETKNVRHEETFESAQVKAKNRMIGIWEN